VISGTTQLPFLFTIRKDMAIGLILHPINTLNLPQGGFFVSRDDI
jgi:hypothetical protein